LSITVTYVDAVNSGFNDPNLGPARVAAFERAVEIWEQQLDGPIPLALRTRWAPNFPNILATSNPTTHYANQPFMVPLTWYPSALASQVENRNLPATSGSNAGFHLYIEFNDVVDQNPQGSGAFYYGLDGNGPANDYDFVTVALHELVHALGWFSLVDYTDGSWSQPFPGDFPDISTKFLTRNGPTIDEDFEDMTDSERFASMTSGELYWFGANIMGATEFTAPPSHSAPEINSEGQVQVHADSPISSGTTLNHWDASHAEPVLMAPDFLSAYKGHDIAEAKELLQDMGWSFTTPSGSGLIAWVDFDFTGTEYGSESLPYNTLAEALSFVESGGTVNIKPGASVEIATIDQVVTINAAGGIVIIGDVTP
jgi:hypothetical protein